MTTVNSRKRRREGSKSDDCIAENEREKENAQPTQNTFDCEVNVAKLHEIRLAVLSNIAANADKMAKQNIQKLGEAAINDNSQVPVPDVDRGPGDLPDDLAVITDINKERGLYRLATKHGYIQSWKSRNEFSII